jgi:ribosomal-protein-alanine N-acetyltransferase
MSAQRPLPPAAMPGAGLRPMRLSDLDTVCAIEQRAYPYPWTRGIFADCLAANYPAWILEGEEGLLGYALLSIAVGESHLLNLCIAPWAQRRGHGRRLLHAVQRLARAQGAERMFLEVRPSNPGAIALYHAEGFNEIGRRARYYPAREGREDAIVMAMELLPAE